MTRIPNIPVSTELRRDCGAVFVNGDVPASGKNLHDRRAMETAFESVRQLIPLRDQFLAEIRD